MAPSLSGSGAQTGPHLEWGVDEGGVGQSGQLFFMSLTGNSIPIKFTPFGRIQKEQDRVRRQRNQLGREADRCWGHGLGPRFRLSSSLLCPQLPLWLR